MRVSHTLKTTSYLLVGSALGTALSSGLLHLVFLILGVIGMTASWFWEPPRVQYRRWSLLWTICAVLAFSCAALAVLLGTDIIIAGTNFLFVLLLIKLFDRQQSNDYRHIYIISFLIMTASTVINAEISYGFFFLCYVVFSTWALIAITLSRELDHHTAPEPQNEKHSSQSVRLDSHHIVDRKFIWGTGVISLGAFVSAMGLFLLFPRIGFGLFYNKGRSSIHMSGFADGVQLGRHGLIKEDKTVVMRVRMAPDYQGQSAPNLYWRGVAFDNYSKGEWSRTSQAPDTRHQLSYRSTSSTHHLLYTQPLLQAAELNARLAGAIKQEIYLESVGYDVLFGASIPLAFTFSNQNKSKLRPGKNDELRNVHSAGIKYTVYSNPQPPDDAILHRAPNTLPAEYQLYLQLPPEIPECETPISPPSIAEINPNCRVRDLARFITKDATTNYAKALALMKWLRTHIGYTVQQQSPGTVEPVEFFLFERQKGHCEYFSSAMAVMARSVGVPTRNVNGFLGGEWNEYSDYIAVRAGDAHSWAEIFIPGHDWIALDPTPVGEADLMGRGNEELLARLRRIADTIRFTWFAWVIEYDLYAQIRLFKNIGNSMKGGANKYVQNPLKRLKTRVSAWAKQYRTATSLMALGMAAITLLCLWRRRRQQYNPAHRPGSPKPVRNPITTAYKTTLRALAKRGYPRSPTTTPREYAAQLCATHMPNTDSLQELTELYYRAEYGTRLSSLDDVKRAQQLASQLRCAMKTHRTAHRAKSALSTKSSPAKSAIEISNNHSDSEASTSKDVPN